MKLGINTPKKQTLSNKLTIGSTPNTTKFSSKRGITSDHIREVPKYLTNTYTPQNNVNLF